jgi:hypothetical protein
MVAKGRIERFKREAASSRSGWKMVIPDLRGYSRLYAHDRTFKFSLVRSHRRLVVADDLRMRL